MTSSLSWASELEEKEGQIHDDGGYQPIINVAQLAVRKKLLRKPNLREKMGEIRGNRK